MHRVSCVWKEQNPKSLPYHSQISLSKHNKHETHWEKSHRLWLGVAVFLFLFTVCLFAIPTTLDMSIEGQGLVPVLERKKGLQQLWRTSVPIKQLEVQEEGIRSVQGRIGGWTLKSNHFTLFNLSSSTPNPLKLSKGILIYVYDLPSKFNEDWLADERCANHLFASEVAIHKVLLNSPIRTRNPYEADFFFLPVYVSCKFSPTTGFPSIGHAPRSLQAAVNLVSTKMEFWNRSEGRDHIFVAAHDYGACFHSMEDVAVKNGIPRFMQNSIILQTFGVQGYHPCQEAEHIQIPPYVSPRAAASYMLADAAQEDRDIFAFFRGKMEIHPNNLTGRVYSRGIRTKIWQKFSHNKRFFLKRHRAKDYQLELLRSVFCLCPLGWAPWSPRIVESVVYGCVPVIIADDIALPYADSINWSDISLTVREKDVKLLYKILVQVTATNLTTIQRNLWKEENRRAMLYSEPLVHGDASWHIFDRLSHKLERSHAIH